MTQSALSTNDLNLIRGTHHYIDDIRLNIFNPDIVATATIDNTPSENPASSLTVTGDISNTKVGQRFIIRDSNGDIVAHGTLRKATSGQTLYISPVSIGDSGYVSTIKRAITASDTITIYKDRPLWGDYSRIVNGSFRKKWDIAYTDENEDTPPIANAGTSQSARISVGDSATFTLPRLGTNTSIVFGSKTISSYLWTLPTGVSLEAGYATSDSVVEVSATQGQHIISLTVTDSNGKTHTAYTYLFVSDGTNYTDLNESYTVTINSDTQDLNGRSIQFAITGTNIDNTIYPGAYVHLQHDSIYDGSNLTTGVDVDIFVGYVTEYQYSHNGDYGQASITAVSPYMYLQRVFMPAQLITEVSNPSNWTEVNSDISNPQGALQYNRWQCQNLFSMHDIDTGAITTPRKYSYEYNGKTIASGLDVAASAILGNIGSASDGTLVLRRNPNYLDNATRNAISIGMTFSADDILPPLEYNRSVLVPYSDIRAGAFAYSGGGASGVKAWYGVKRWSQGAGETILPDFTVDATNGKTTVLETVGHLAADLQSPDTISINLNRNINIIDPVYMIWFRLNLSSDYDPSGNGWNNTRFIAQRVNRNWDNENQTLSIQVTLKEETFGQQADEWIIGSGATVVSGGWVTELGIDYTPSNDDFSILPNVAIANDTNGNLAITQNFTDSSPIWTSLDDLFLGHVCDVCYDYNSAFFTSGYDLSEPLSIYVVSADSTTLSIYRLYDIKASNFEAELLTSYTMNDSSTLTSARIACSSTTTTLVVSAWHDQTGVLFGRSLDGGDSWTSATRVGDAITDTDNDNSDIGLYITGVNQVVTAPNSTSEYGVYIATTANGVFTRLTNSPAGLGAPNYMITGDGNTTLYVTSSSSSLSSVQYDLDMTTASTVDYEITTSIDSGRTAINPIVFPDASFGNTAPSIKAAFVQAGVFRGLNVNVDITLTSEIIVKQVSFQYYYTQPVSNVLSRSIQLYDVSDNLLASYATVANDAAKLSWQTVDRFFNQSNVKRIRCRISVVGGSGFTAANTFGYVDNISIVGLQ